jgi:CRISPR system Cascade subunit CasD
VTGLLANALGWHRGERERHQDLQDRLVMGARLDRSGTELRDFQTAQLAKNDKGWTTRGVPEGRGGGADTYKSPHIRLRNYRADAFVTVALRLNPPDGDPTLARLAEALAAPARPLFIGRKPCLPSRPVLAEPMLEAENVFEALRRAPLADAHSLVGRREASNGTVRLAIPPSELPDDQRTRQSAHASTMLADVRDWNAGVHAGESRLDVLSLSRASFQPWPAEVLP